MDETVAESFWAPAETYQVVDAMTADATTRSMALAPRDGVWWWITHGSAPHSDAREIQIERLRTGLDLLVVR
jgi:hypothetical protein